MQPQRSHRMKPIRACRALAWQARQCGDVYTVGGECDTVQQKCQSPDMNPGGMFCQAGRACLVQPEYFCRIYASCCQASCMMQASGFTKERVQQSLFTTVKYSFGLVNVCKVYVYVRSHHFAFHSALFFRVL